jgi:fatty acid desaturase
MPTDDPSASGFSFRESLRGAFWTIVLGVIVVYVFFLALGAFSIGDVVPVTILIAVLVGIFFWHMARERRHHDEEDRDPRLRAARARRGF